MVIAEQQPGNGETFSKGFQLSDFADYNEAVRLDPLARATLEAKLVVISKHNDWIAVSSLSARPAIVGRGMPLLIAVSKIENPKTS